jgi:hypothetical protein
MALEDGDPRHFVLSLRTKAMNVPSGQEGDLSSESVRICPFLDTVLKG